MSDDSLARSPPAAPLSVDVDYDAIHTTIVATERGRWFLDQHAQRYRAADTERVLTVLTRIEQAIRGGNAAVPADLEPGALATVADAIRQARREVVSRHGDPAASGEAALAEFRNATDQIQDLVWAAQSQAAGSDLGAQLSFQTNRLLAAGERLEGSIAALQVLLGAVDDIDQHLTLLTLGRELIEEVDVHPEEPVAAQPAEAALTEWSLPQATLSMERPAEPALSLGPMPDESRPEQPQPQPLPEMPHAHQVWDMAVAPEAVTPPETAAVAEAAIEISVTDWAFAAPDVEPDPEPAPAAFRPLPPADLGLTVAPASALDRLEAREYGRRLVATAVAPPPVDEIADAPADAAPPPGGGIFDDLVQSEAAMSAEFDRPLTPEPMAEAQWSIEEVAAPPAAEPIFDADLFDTDDSGVADEQRSALIVAEPTAEAEAEAFDDVPEPTAMEPAPFAFEMTGCPADDQPTADGPADVLPLPEEPETPEERELRLALAAAALPAMPAEPDREPTAAYHSPAERAPAADTPSVLERLESMRGAIAALMDEVSEKTARRVPPQPRD